MKVIASSLRKGNVVDVDGKLYVVLTAQNIHPGKGTPVTQIDMRRISDGVKVSERYRTTEQVERAFVEDREHTFLYQDGEGFHFMNPETYEQVAVPEDIIGDQAAYLQEGMAVMLCTHNGVPIAIELPARVTLEIVETEPVVKGQTASSSYKPAKLSNGVPHHGAAAHPGRHPGRDHDRGRLLRGAREGLSARSFALAEGRRELACGSRLPHGRHQPPRRRCRLAADSGGAGAGPAATTVRCGPLIDLSQAVPGRRRLIRTSLARLAASAGSVAGRQVRADRRRRGPRGRPMRPTSRTLYDGRIEPRDVAVTAGCNLAFFAAMMLLAAPGRRGPPADARGTSTTRCPSTCSASSRAPLPCRPEAGFVPRVADAERAASTSACGRSSSSRRTIRPARSIRRT